MLYEQGIEPHRQAFAKRVEGFSFRDADSFHLFLIWFCAYGVGMTEPVEGWIRRAGERCIELGYDTLGKALQAHARHEAGHHEMMIADTRALIDIWRGAPLDADEALARPYPPGVRAYRQMHEDLIESAEPYGQIAVEYEIEYLSVTHGASLITSRLNILGDRAEAIASRLSFLREHVALDVAHTQFNRRQMEQFVDSYPETVPSVVQAGRRALDTYGRYLGDCMEAATGQAADPKRASRRRKR
jgi:hypothetical protein